MKLLVIGGCGYLGSVLVKKLVSNGHDVSVLDSLLYGACETDVPLIEGDITDNKSVSKTLDGKDAIIHLAAIVGEAACNLDADHSVRVNYLATRNIAHLCEERNLRLLFASTASVYGALPGLLLNEKAQLFPTSIYATTKLAAEDAVRSICRNHVIFRMGTLFGCSPRMRFDLVVNKFVAMAISREPLVVFGGSRIRPLLHVEDAADAFAKAVESQSGGLFNLGGNNYRIVDVAHIVAESTKVAVNIYEELVDRRDYRLDSNLAINAFGVSFPRTVENSIQHMIELSARLNWKKPIYDNETWLRNLAVAKS